MKPWITVLLLAFCSFAGPSKAQERIDGSTSRQERLRQERNNNELYRRGTNDSRQLDQLLRLRERSDQRTRQLRQPTQRSAPANTRNPRSNVVRTQ